MAKHAVSLNPSTLGEAVGNNSLVMFHNPWCKDCNAIMPAYEDAALQLHQEYPHVQVSKVNMNIYGNEIYQKQIGRFVVPGGVLKIFKSYPTLMFFSRRGTYTVFDRDNTADSIVAFAREFYGDDDYALTENEGLYDDNDVSAEEKVWTDDEEEPSAVEEVSAMEEEHASALKEEKASAAQEEGEETPLSEGANVPQSKKETPLDIMGNDGAAGFPQAPFVKCEARWIQRVAQFTSETIVDAGRGVSRSYFACMRQAVGKSTYWNDKTVCKACHEFGRRSRKAREFISPILDSLTHFIRHPDHASKIKKIFHSAYLKASATNLPTPERLIFAYLQKHVDVMYPGKKLVQRAYQMSGLSKGKKRKQPASQVGGAGKKTKGGKVESKYMKNKRLKEAAAKAAGKVVENKPRKESTSQAGGAKKKTKGVTGKRGRPKGSTKETATSKKRKQLTVTRAIKVDKYLAEIVKYKERQEQEDPGKPWDGHVPALYCVTLEDGTKANVGAWVNCRKMDRKNRLRNGFEEKSLAEERLDAIGILWEARARTRTIEVDEYLAEIVKYKERQEQEDPGKPWDGHVPVRYCVKL